ncbi:YhgE/Pip domain-containing protein [Bacillus sp. V59.32b]|uniref:YhgE/Pip domain-containing protein n=1 Tax=Bacillus sp. V59.32b TaxID=1758642 RepID=UPI000E3CB104|nr:YhgE/Pip domain-containing protein [Bacillus sp. V59.32b]RFU60130.1 YhgE/Pip domain-containing protein [Bacillus sp. V59.32b]
MIRSLLGEFKGIYKNKKMLIAISGILFIPLLYSATYLWAFWDPYGHVERMPVAVVNHDTATEYNGETLTIGEDLVEKLKDKETFDYHFVNEKDADRGLQNGKYYIKIEIPENFSQNATTLQDEKPKKLNLIYTANEGSNYLSSKIGDSAIEKMKAEVSATVTKTYAESMFDNIKDVAKGLDEAAGGAGELNEGIESAKNGAGELQDGIESAKDGSDKLNKGAGDLHTGAGEIQKNLETLAEKSVTFSGGLHSASAGSKELNNGLQQFSTGLGQMKEGQSELLEGAKESQSGAAELSDGLDESLAGIQGMMGQLPQSPNGGQGITDSELTGRLAEVKEGAAATSEKSAEVSTGLNEAIKQTEKIMATTDDPDTKAEMAKLKEQLVQLQSVNSGVSQGVEGLADHATQVVSESAQQLSGGAGQLQEAQNELFAGFKQLAAGQEKLAAGAEELETGQGQLVAGLTTFGDKIDEAQMGLDALTEGGGSLSSGLDQLAQGSGQLKDGTSKLSNGSQELTNGTSQLSEGSANLAEGMDKLKDGSNELSNGMNELSDGAKELSDKLKDGADDAGDVKANDDVYDMFAKPVDVKEARLNEVPNYGTALAPYFLSLSLYVGGLVLTIIFPLRNPAISPNSGFSWFISKLGVMLTVGVFQALLVDFALLQWLDLEVKSVPYLILLSVMTSWTYLAIIQFLATAFDNPGRFVSILILIMQLTSSGGTFPIELSPKVFQQLNQYLPMTYSIAGFRSVISTGDYEFLWHNIGTISIFFVVFMLATLAYFTLTYKRMKHVFAHDGEAVN